MLDEWLPSSHTVVMLPAQLADYDRLDSVVRVLVAWRKQGRWLDPRRDTYLGCPKLPGVCRVDMNVDGEACRFVFVDCVGGAIRSTGTGRPLSRPRFLDRIGNMVQERLLRRRPTILHARGHR